MTICDNCQWAMTMMDDGTWYCSHCGITYGAIPDEPDIYDICGDGSDEI